VNFARKSIKVAVAVLAVVLILIAFVLFITGNDPALSTDINSHAMKRSYINSVIVTFNGVRANLKNHNEADTPENIYKKQEQLKTRYISKIIFGQAGEFVFISDIFGIVIVIHPIVDSSSMHSWHCSTYPAVSFDSLCSSLR
jgi:hypothetical protein